MHAKEYMYDLCWKKGKKKIVRDRVIPDHATEEHSVQILY
jgi:hypothetical protein